MAEAAGQRPLNAGWGVFSGGVDIGEYTAERAFSMLDAFHCTLLAMVEAIQPVLMIVDRYSYLRRTEELVAAYGDLER